MQNFKNPQIEVIGAIDLRNEAWKISRPHLKVTDKELMDIRKLDLPVQSFASVYFNITGSLLLRDVLYHVRPTADWARSNRTTKINKDTLYYSGEYKDCKLDEKVWEYCTDESINLDIRKDKFPYEVSTDFCWGGDLRTIATMLNSMENELPALYGVYGPMFHAALKSAGIENLPPSRNDYFSSLAIDPAFIHKDSNDSCDVSINEQFDTVVIQYRGKGSLLSQFIRQHVSRVRSSLITLLMDPEYNSIDKLVNLSQDRLFDMQVITNIEGAKKLISTRSCWFAKFDMASRSSWSDIITKLIQEFGGEFEEHLPCKGCADNCKWKTEQLARCIAGNPNGSTGEVNPPCPYITGIPEVTAIREAKFNSNSSLFNLWKAKGPKKLNITEYGIRYLNNVHQYGFAEKCDNENEQLKQIAENLYTKINK